MMRGSISVDGFCGDVFETQRRLRSQLLDRPIIRHKPARDLAAHMLLSIDDLDKCWSIATRWLQTELSCHRVDAGFGVSSDTEYFPGFAEAKNDNYDVPSFGGGSVYNRDPAMQAMWFGSSPVVFADIKQDNRVTPYLRRRISGARTKSKFGGALRNRSGGYGLICADWTEHHAPHESGLFDCFEQTVADVLSPIVSVAREIDHCEASRIDDVSDDQKIIYVSGSPLPDSLLGALTRSELEVARLVAQGLSYKEIARIRDRSFSTIDHQLRSIRKKTGVASTTALIGLLSRLEASEN